MLNAVFPGKGALLVACGVRRAACHLDPGSGSPSDYLRRTPLASECTRSDALPHPARVVHIVPHALQACQWMVCIMARASSVFILARLPVPDMIPRAGERRAQAGGSACWVFGCAGPGLVCYSLYACRRRRGSDGNSRVLAFKLKFWSVCVLHWEESRVVGGQ